MMPSPWKLVDSRPPLAADDWQLRRRSREMCRKLRLDVGGTARKDDSSQNPFAHLAEQSASPIVDPGSYAKPVDAKFAPRPEFGQVLAWLVTLIGFSSLAAGLGMIGWSIAHGGSEYWDRARALTLAGQGLLIFGLVLVVSRLWRSSRYASSQLHEVHTELGQLQRSADASRRCAAAGPRPSTPSWFAARAHKCCSRISKGSSTNWRHASTASGSSLRPARALRFHSPRDFLDHIGALHAPLLERVAIADRDGVVGQRLAVDRDAVRRAGFVLAAVAAADRPFFVVEHVEPLLEGRVNLGGHFRHAVLLHQREDGGLDRGDPRVELHHHAGLHFALVVRCLVLVVGLAEERQRRPIGAGRRFDHVRHEPLVR